MISVSKSCKNTGTDLRILQRDFPLGTDPKIFKLNITNFCNYSCIICPHNKITKPKGFMSEELFTTIVDRDMLPGQYVELFNYGEPFLYPWLADFCRILGEKDIQALISTNCSTGHNKVRDVLSNRNVRMLLCLESLDSDIYRRITGGRLGKVLEFIDLVYTHRSFDGQVTILTVESQLNRDHSEKVRDVYGDKFPVVCRLSDSFGGNIDDRIVFDGEGDRPVARVPCIFPFVNCAVDWDGKVGWCCFDYNTPVPYGDMNDNSLKEIWDGPVWTELRERHLALDLQGTICEKCTGWRDVLYDKNLYHRLVDEDDDNYYYFVEDK